MPPLCVRPPSLILERPLPKPCMPLFMLYVPSFHSCASHSPTVHAPISSVRPPQAARRAPKAAVRAPKAAVRAPKAALRAPEAAVFVPEAAVRAPHKAYIQPSNVAMMWQPLWTK
jgi:hypothetical protein